MQHKDIIQLAAEEARKWTEAFAKKNRHIGDPTDLACYCGIASSKLAELLDGAGFDALIACNDHHAFVVVEDLIVDVTATQFDQDEKVVIADRLPGKCQAKWYWEIKWLHMTPHSFKEHQRRAGWPRSQWARVDLSA